VFKIREIPNIICVQDAEGRVTRPIWYKSRYEKSQSCAGIWEETNQTWTVPSVQRRTTARGNSGRRKPKTAGHYYPTSVKA